MKTFSFTFYTAVLVLLLAGCGISTTKKMPAATAQLTADQKYALAFMWNEEKLAKDLYLALSAYYPDANLSLAMIATMSEVTHIATVESFVQAYDINITNLVDYTRNYSEAELRALAPGEFAVAEIQQRYDDLYAYGTDNNVSTDALKAGCIVEVQDINDLNNSIAVMEGIDDIVAAFELLRSESYKHYTKISKDLKDLGVSKGCCVLGAEYCLSPL